MCALSDIVEGDVTAKYEPLVWSELRTTNSVSILDAITRVRTPNLNWEHFPSLYESEMPSQADPAIVQEIHAALVLASVLRPLF